MAKRGRAVDGSGMQPRKRSDGRWEVRYCAGFAIDGKPIRKSIYGSTSKEVSEKLREVTAAIDAGTYHEPNKLPVAEWMEIWLSQYTGAIKTATRALYRNNANAYIIPTFGKVKLFQLTPHMVQMFINSLYKDKGLNPKTVKNIHCVLSKSLSEACRIGYLASNPCKGCILPKPPNDEIKAMEAEEITAFLAVSKQSPLEQLFFFALNTGMRLSEILGLRWSRVDFSKSTITVDCQLLIKRGTIQARTLGSPKNGKSRTFKAPPAVMDCLRAVRRQQAEWKLKAGDAWMNELGLVFTNEIGQELVHSTVEHKLTHLLEAANLQDCGYHFHTLRHTFTVEALRAGVDVKTVSQMLGHASVAFTLDVYASVSAGMQDEAANKLQARIMGRS